MAEAEYGVKTLNLGYFQAVYFLSMPSQLAAGAGLMWGGSVAKGLWQQLLENTKVLLCELSLSLLPQVKIR